ncbi:3-deoxy-manno-octulosonate cytidylyltransferase [Pedobacter ginsengisoli]|uniref:3-deoxy-manno-octulosonate cytidylyltransferase n=1 Tax=Pedobacter ginsengisoli TaxID=363852 RepID=A0A2D1U2L4_9SPHI|nr:3-deoxy-manno-octulosonate cytidylyltransferase [Pedobacter ginsengisoli]ATP55857.1 3-deoxy-manno-octulosonate cytidylyltransferase [Pedobacter ginsengisoli]
MKILGIIPARYASTRFPGKPLVQIKGKSMIQRVYEQAGKAKSLSEVIVATDDERIANEVQSFGGKFIFTASTHLSGTDRCAEVAATVSGYDAIINIQGDEPYINPEQIDLLASCFIEKDVQLATLIKKIHTENELFNINIPKVVINTKGEATYFSRQTIPYVRNQEKENWLNTHQFYKHIGIYGYTYPVLLEITKLAPSSLELAENLEQLRWIENGYRIKTKVTEIETIAIDTPEDLIKINNGV